MPSLPNNRIDEIDEMVGRLRHLLARGVVKIGPYAVWYGEGGNRVTVSHQREVIFEANPVVKNHWFISDESLQELKEFLQRFMVLDDLADV